MVFLANNVLGHGQLTQYGIIPRHLNGLPGILGALRGSSLSRPAPWTVGFAGLTWILGTRCYRRFWMVFSTRKHCTTSARCNTTFLVSNRRGRWMTRITGFRCWC